MADPIKSQTWVTDTVLDAPALNTYNRDNWDYIRPKTVKALGTFNAVFSAAAAVTGTLTFGVTFTASPIVLFTVQVGANRDVNINMTAAPTTTQVSWRAFQNTATNFSDTAVIHWIAIGTVA